MTSSSARAPRDARVDASASTSSSSSSSSFTATYARGVEYDGALVSDATTTGEKESLEACERACRSKRGRNVFVWSTRGDGACWLKRVDGETPRRMREGEENGWDSGTIDEKDLPRDVGEVLAGRAKARAVTMSMDGFGDVRLTLKLEWHESSADYLRALASESETSCEETCEVYRVEGGKGRVAEEIASSDSERSGTTKKIKENLETMEQTVENWRRSGSEAVWMYSIFILRICTTLEFALAASALALALARARK